MYCVKCGNLVEDGCRFCTKCGAPMNVDDQAPSAAGAATQAMPNAQGVQQPGVPAQPIPGSSQDATEVMPSVPGAQAAGYTQPASGYVPGYPAAGGNTPQQPTVGYAPAQPASANAAQGKGGSNKTAVIIIAVVAALALVGVLLALTQCGKDNGSSSASNQTVTLDQTAESGNDADPNASSSNDGGADATTESNTGDSKSDSGEQNEVDTQAQREQEAYEAALSEGKQIFSGNVIVTTMADRAHERDSRLHDFDNNNDPYVVLQMDGSVTFEAMAGDGTGLTHAEGDSFALPIGQFDAYDGQEITIAVAADQMWTYSDVTGVLASAHVNEAELISPLDGNDSSASTSSSSGDYVLADSDSRYYTRSELEAMDNLTLYHARNEIFARHGRQFKNQDLQEFFGSKSWYSGTIAPEDFSETVLNDYEKKNAELMLAIEKERNSPYLA
ncbi:MAG: YARHG domain-containing protein [Eggerthellaceae bacterium]|nr:YARHG domain-containing protein [Eggerthellaceae bacterium]